MEIPKRPKNKEELLFVTPAFLSSCQLLFAHRALIVFYGISVILSEPRLLTMNKQELVGDL